MIRIASDSDKARWNEFVDNHPAGTFFHRFEWKEVIDKAIKHKTYYLIAEDDSGTITGVLPLTHVKSILFGSNMVSNPFCVYGGVIANDQNVELEILEYAKKLTVENNADSLELRNLEPVSVEGDWPTKELYCTFIKELSSDHDENMKAIPRKQRAMVRKAIKFELEYQIDDTLDNFFLAYETSVRNLGTPVFSRKYFRALKETFGDMCDVLTTTHEGEIVTSVMNFYYKDTVLPFYGGGTSKARALAGNDFMYWSLMQHAVEKGMKFFDYGRSKVDTGAYFFKKNWGFEPKPLHYQYFLNKADQIPEVNPLNPKYRIFIEAWKRLPLPIARRIGPVISRNLG
ncbi:FemAB family XrtA/PEP-CTERM system-associated protein [Pleionea sp. CnH1-48]|uniref:FemAB family XrtA/PEP-CTERM system-associated protein n=1 Tax=Pleionea sp. CnH1-48 TaxID=2954494 RepID=UPI0020979823|nr:FemAB family XrtA/PEP-CTERM system-associated protein [Pleionea sp. CnH1-48]MCO7226251.1 FemAB family PEP-CTERM system-associated protein [Pleionea sp. CnH1-48]